MFHVGQKVVCIRDYVHMPHACWGHETLPKKGEVYTVRQLVAPDESIGRPVCILLSEIVNKLDDYVDEHREFCFRHDHFRPVKTTNIGVFLKMLEPTPVDA